MKKYVKPELFFENYELSQHIAACVWDLNLVNDSVCGFHSEDFPGVTIFTVASPVGPCEFVPEDGYCYWSTGGDGYNTFNS